MRPFLIFILALIILKPVSAQDSLQRQSVYKFKLGLDIPIGTVALGSGLTSLFLKKKKQPLTLEEIQSLQISDVNKWDRTSIHFHNKGAKISSDVLQISAMVSPAFLYIDKNIRKDWKTVTPIWMETFALTTGLTALTKELVKRKRPFVYNPNAPLGDKYSKDAKASFWSGHTAISAASMFFIAKVWTDYHPNSKYKPLFWTGAAVLPAVVGLCRVGAGKHYYTDVLTGYAIGTLVGILVPHLHKRFHP